MCWGLYPPNIYLPPFFSYSRAQFYSEWEYVHLKGSTSQLPVTKCWPLATAEVVQDFVLEGDIFTTTFISFLSAACGGRSFGSSVGLRSDLKDRNHALRMAEQKEKGFGELHGFTMLSQDCPPLASVM